MPQIHLNLSEDMHKRLRLASDSDRRSMIAQVAHILDGALPALPTPPVLTQNVEPREDLHNRLRSLKFNDYAK